LTDFEDELEEVAEPVFVRRAAIKVPLESGEVEAVEQMAQAKRVSREECGRRCLLYCSLTLEPGRLSKGAKSCRQNGISLQITLP